MNSMKNKDIIKVLKQMGYTKVSVSSPCNVKTYYQYKGGLHIQATKNLSFHIDPSAEKIGMGRFGVCVEKDGKGTSIDINYPKLFFSILLAFLNGVISESQIINKYSI